MKGNHSCKQEGFAFVMLDGHFKRKEQIHKCCFCYKYTKTLVHLATCHNEVWVRSIHLCLMQGMGSLRLSYHSVVPLNESNQAKITADLPAMIEIPVKSNRPNFMVHNKVKREIYLIEVEISCIKNINQNEVDKMEKYQRLASEFQAKTEMKITVILLVMSRDGVEIPHFKHCSDSSPRSLHTCR